jgi:hypothetical protein
MNGTCLSIRSCKKIVRVALLWSLATTGGCGSRSGLDAVWLGEPDSSELAVSPPPDSAGVSDPRRRAAMPPAEQRTGCVDITRRYTSTPPTVLLLIDQSASMLERFGTSTRWDVLRTAIVNPDGGLLSWLGANVNIGLTLYTSLNGYDGGLECPIMQDVDVQLGNADAIRDFYQNAEPLAGGDTPTGDAIDAAVAELGAGPSKYVILLTDGVPDTCLVGETRSPRRVSPNVEEVPSAECPIGPASTRPS